MSGDATLFMRADQVEASWSVLMPILDMWGNSIPTDFPNYQSGTWGPKGCRSLNRKRWSELVTVPPQRYSERESTLELNTIYTVYSHKLNFCLIALSRWEDAYRYGIQRLLRTGGSSGSRGAGCLC